MRIYGRRDLEWVRNSLWISAEDKYILAIVADLEHPSMYWIKWPDGTQSDDYYSKTRAKDHAMSLTLQDLNLDTQETGVEGVSGAFK